MLENNSLSTGVQVYSLDQYRKRKDQTEIKMCDDIFVKDFCDSFSREIVKVWEYIKNRQYHKIENQSYENLINALIDEIKQKLRLIFPDNCRLSSEIGNIIDQNINKNPEFLKTIAQNQTNLHMAIKVSFLFEKLGNEWMSIFIQKHKHELNTFYQLNRADLLVRIQLILINFLETNIRPIISSDGMEELFVLLTKQVLNLSHSITDQLMNFDISRKKLKNTIDSNITKIF